MSEIQKKSAALVELCRQKKLKLVCAESCTGGQLAAAITSVSGASDVFDCGFITYSNQAKAQFLNVPMELINQHGAVSIEVASAMASGAFLAVNNADVAVSITGIAGPTGGSLEKPVGTVCFGLSHTKTGANTSYIKYFSGNRAEIQAQAVLYAIDIVTDILIEM